MVICSGELHFHNATLFGIFLLDKKGRRRRKLFSSSLLKLSYLSNSISNEQTNDSTQGRSSKMLLSSDSENVDGPAILQLQKWGPLPFDLSKVRQALISPTREILILLSYHYEALLLPLVTGEVTPEDNLEGCDSECNQGISSSARLDSSRSDSFDNIPCTSESVEVVSDKAFSLENTSSRSKHYPVVFDVKSLAWAHCGDAYNQHKDAAFREVLFMSGDHGVTVHAFRHLDRDNKNIKHSPDCMVGQGRWVEWGPSTSQYSTQENELSTLCNRDAGDLSHIKAVENSHDVNEGGNNDSSTSGFTSKKWLKTFLTEVETVKFEGKFLTRFPESSFPSSAEIISFSLLNDTKTFLDFLSQSNPVSDIKENWSGATMLLGSTNDTSVHLNSSSLNSVDSSDSISIISSSDSNNSFKCFRVFSSSSHRLIGLVLTLGDPLVNNDEEIVRSMNRIYVMVAMIHQWGIQWLSSVKLQATNVNLGQEFEWIDFQFSDNLLVCLSASGLISLYGVTTGEPIQCLDVLKICGCNPKPNLPKQEKLSIEEDLVLRQSIHDERNCNERTNNIKGALCTKGIFKRLIVASSSSFLAAVDEYGVIYLICPDDYIPELYSSINKLLPHFQHLGTGMSVGWEVGGLEIGCQKIPAGISNGDSLNVSTTENKHSLQKQEYLRGEHYAFCSQSSGFSAESPTASPSSNLSSNRVRRVILPIDGCGRDDSICFSSLGITRLVRTCNINGKKGYKIVYSKLHAVPSVNDDIGVTSQSTSLRSFGREAGLFEEAVGCAFQGCFYLVTHDGLSVVLPSVSVSSNVLSVESVGYWRPSFAACNGYQMENFLPVKRSKILYPPWKMEILDKILLYEGPEEADHMCLVNGWDLTVARLRRLQLALDYLKTDEIEESLEMLVEVNLAEEGVLRLLFTSIHRTFCKVNNDNEFALASRLLNLAASFAIKMVRKYGLLQHDKDRFLCQENSGNIITYIPPTFSNKESSEISYSRRLCEMAHFLEVIRNLQRRLNSKCKRPIQGLVDDMNALSIMDTKLVPDDSDLPSLQADVVSLSDAHYPSDLAFDGKQNLAVMPMDSFEQVGNLGPVNFEELTILSSEGSIEGRKLTSMENPKAMIARWEIDNLDLKTVVKDALHSGRLPLAVLQLHLQHLRDIVTEEEPRDIFNEVRDVGRAIAYDLFLKGETSLAVATLQRLGEDLEVNLKQLLFGTMRRSLRMQIVEEMHRYGFLTPKEWKILEQISLIERLYPSSSFWRTFNSQQEMNEVSSDSTLPEENKLQLKFSYLFNDCNIECGEVDGVVIGPWANISGNFAFPLVDEDTTHVGYWAAAAVWSDAWDQITIDRVVLDRPFLMGVHVSWEFQLEYHVCHNDWEEISKLLDIIPSSSLSEGSLLINLDGLNSSTNVGRHRVYSDYENYLWSTEDLDSVCMNIPNIKFLKSSASNMCSMWLKMRIEQTLAKKFIFLKEFWEGTAEIVGLLSRSGFIIDKSRTSVKDESLNCASDLSSSNLGEELDKDTVHAFHKLIIRHCAQYNLPNLLDLYLDHHKLVLDNDSLTSLLDAAGDCEWAKWLLLSRVKGREYDASFSNARSVILRNLVPDSNINILEIDEIVRTVDDMAEGGGEIAALATLMYASVPIQKCLCSGSVNRHISSSSQCTLENLRPALQRFPTLWRTLVAACFGQDVTGSSLGATSKNVSVFGNSALSNYLNWRESIFSSSGRDTSLLQMLPCWFSKAIRRLVQLFVQGPIGWQSAAMSEGESFVHRDIDFFISTHENADINAVSWEAAIQKSVEEELHASSIKESGFGIEHHLHRGRALAAFNHLLSARVEKLKSGQSGGSAHGQTNVQADVQMLLAPVTQSEQSLLSSVTPLAIMHFEDSILVAACAFLLELCGLSASMLRVDIAALRRIASFYGSSEHDDHMKHLSPKTSAMHAVSHEGDIPVSLARALADDYLHRGSTTCSKEKENSNDVPTSNQASRALVAVLRQLEKVSLPSMLDGKTCGAWLFDGSGDGTEIRSQQKAASQYWSLVTSFCQMHQLPVSTKYLAVLARDNDWIGFLTEAQVGEYPFDLIIQVASKEFSDPRLKIHITTVLRSMYLTRKKASSPSNSTSWGRSNVIDFSTQANVMFPVELFELLAKCEKQKNPGEALLLKAKDLRWSLLAMIASCFPDVTSLSCLTVWLEITAARETSSIKVNDIASQIANSVGAAVEATNSLTAPSRIFSFRYNRKNAKRRRLIESTTGKQLTSTPSNVSTSGLVGIPVAQDFIVKEETINYLEEVKVFSDPDEALVSLSKMVGVLCEQRLFLPLLRAFEMFLPSCSLLPFIRALQAFSQMRLSEASAHLASFSARIKEEPLLVKTNIGRDGQIGSSWISSTAVGAADALLSTCPSAYEKRCLLQLLAATDFCDGGSAATCFRRLYWKINLAEPSLRKDDELYLGDETLDDASLLMALEKNGHWEQARNWARQLEASGGPWKFAVNRVTEKQAEAMVAEWKEYLWDVPEERAALWSHCQTLFLRYSFPALQAGSFFLNHAEAVEGDVPARELHEMLLLALQWLSGTMTQSNPVYPLHLLREIETRVWLLAVESEAQFKNEGEFTLSTLGHNLVSGNNSSIIDRTASIVTKMDNHLNVTRNRVLEKNDTRESSLMQPRSIQALDATAMTGGSTKTKRRAKSYLTSRRPLPDAIEKNIDSDDGSASPMDIKNSLDLFKSLPQQEESVKLDVSLSRWEERVGPEELERAVLSLLEFGQVTAAQQLQQKLSPAHVPSEFLLIDAALKLAAISTPSSSEVSVYSPDEEVLSVIKSYSIIIDNHPLQVLEDLATKCTKDGGLGLCKRIIAVVKAANVLGLQFSEAFAKRPLDLLQLLSLKAQDSLEEAKLLVRTHSMPPASIAQILAESFLKGLLAAHRGGYMDSQKEEGPAPLLWRISDFLKWAELCPSEPEIGHALMRLVITGQEIPRACEVELLILSHHFYKSSACLDGVDVLVALAATRVESYVSEGDFSCLARLVIGVSNFHALNFILGILIENGQLELLLQKYSAADTTTGTAETVRGFRMAVLTSLKHFNPYDLDAFAMVYNHFDMKHETAALLESRAMQSIQQWFLRYDRDQSEDLLESMCYFIKAAEVHSTIDAGNKTRYACAQASLLSLQIRMPDFDWLNLSMTNARRALVEQSRFLEALIVAEAYNLNQPSEWALVLWNQMFKPELTEEFVAEFVSVLPLQPSMLADIAKFYRAEVAARVDHSNFSMWLSPAEWLKHLARSFRCLLKRTRDLRLRLQLANVATGFGDMVEACMKELDRVPDTAGPLVLRKGHGGAYLPLM